MSVTDVTSRIHQIQAQLALLPGAAAGGSSAVSAAGFSRALGRVSAPGGAGGSAVGEQVVAEARKALGVPYVWGGNDLTSGVDCSGLVQQVFRKHGIELPRLSADQARAGVPVASLAEARPGDLIAWDNSGRNVGADHVAIYVGNGQMIEAPRPGGVVQLVDVTTPPDYIRRVIPEGAAAAASTGAAPAVGRVTGATPYAELFNRAGATHQVDPALLAAVARQESGYDPGAQSPAGAQGLMQLMPATAKGLGVTNSFDPAQAVDGAARLLHDLIDRFGRVDHALAAYNAGPGAVLRYDGIPPYPETQNYVRSVTAMWRSS
jgi:hypothetical protein